MIILEQTNGHKLGLEETAIKEYVSKKYPDTDIIQASVKQISRGKLINELKVSTLAVGSVDFINRCLKSIGRKYPEQDTYPSHLRKYMNRFIIESTLEKLPYMELPKFIKPKNKTKLFTGFVCTDNYDYRVASFSKRTPIYVSEIVDFKAEYRVYVLNKYNYQCVWYHGDREFKPDPKVIFSMVNTLLFEDMPVVLDVGVTGDNVTSLIEVNEATSIGIYEGVDIDLYYTMIQTKWASLLSYLNRR